MPRTILSVSLMLGIFLLGCREDPFSKKPSKLTDKELYGILESTIDRDFSPYWEEAEKRQIILIKVLAHDKSGPILKLIIDNRFSENAVRQYLLYKLQDPTKLSYAEKGILFFQVAAYQLKEAVPLILKALEGETSINPHIAAAYAFGRLNAQETRAWLERNLDAEYRESLGSGSPFDESKRDELLKASGEALKALEKESGKQ
jgi:hypothetical protein